MSQNATYNCDADCLLDSGSPSTNRDGWDVYVWYFGGKTALTWRSVLRWDDIITGRILAGSTIESADLELYIEVAAGTPENFSVLRLTNPWAEGTVTWNSRDFSNAWSTPGGDYSSPSAVHAMPTSTGTAGFDITELVQDALDNRSGLLDLLIKSTNESGVDGFQADHLGGLNHPARINVTWSSPKGPSGGGRIRMPSTTIVGA